MAGYGRRRKKVPARLKNAARAAFATGKSGAGGRKKFSAPSTPAENTTGDRYEYRAVHNAGPQGNPQLPDRGQAAAAADDPLAVFESRDFPARTGFECLRCLRQAALRGGDQRRPVRKRQLT